MRLHASCLPWAIDALHKLPEITLLYLFVKKLLTGLKGDSAEGGSCETRDTWKFMRMPVSWEGGVSISKREKCKLSKTEGLAASLNWLPKWIEERG